MDFLKSINKLRRNLLLRITKNIGSPRVPSHAGLNSKQIQKVLICRPNHRLGNLLLITPLVQEVISTFPGCKIDLFVKGNLAPALFKNFENINSFIELPRRPFNHLWKYTQGWLAIKRNRYDLVINVVHNSSSGRLAAKFANSKYKFFGDPNENIPSKSKGRKHLAKYPVYHLRDFLTRLGLKTNSRAVASLDLKLTPLEIVQGQQQLKTLVNNNQKTICLYTYATGAKCYSRSWWKIFYNRLKNEYPLHNIIEVLPIENVSQLLFKVPTFYSKDIREIGALIANTEVFISADNGVMHLASATQTTTIGLFSVTDKDVYGPYNHNSVGISVTTDETDECIEVLHGVLKPEIIHERSSLKLKRFEHEYDNVKQA